MDKNVSEFQSTVDDVHSTSRFILKRLNESLNFSDGGYFNSACCSSEPVETEISALQSRVKELEERVSKRDDTRLTDDVKALNERLTMLENIFAEPSTGTENIDVFNNTKDWGRQTDLGTEVKNKTDTEAKRDHVDLNVKVSAHGESGETVSETEPPPIPLKNDGKMGFYSHKETCNGPTKSTNDTSAEKENVSKENHGNVVKGTDDSNSETGAFGESTKYTSKENKQRKGQGTINKPNFTITKRQTVSEKIVKQEIKLVLNGDSYWRSLAQNELERLRTQYQFLQGVHTVVCLDISGSMAQSNAWTEARTFLTDYLSGLEKMSKLYPTDLKSEYVSFVTFGHETKVQIGYTDHYKDIQKRLDKIVLGGPTQMYGGILMALAAAWCSGHQIEQLSNSSHVFTKIIIITDGRPTEYDLIAGPDIPDNSKVDETKASILQEMERFRNNNKDLFFVPVGVSDLDFLNTMVACSSGMLLDHRHGQRLARRQFLTAKLVDPLGLMAGTLLRGSDSDISSEDKEDLQNIQERAKRHLDESVTAVGGKEMYGESKNKELPSVGSRVRRGPDWHYGMQDQNGPGTIIGHADNDNQVWVEWDIRGHQNIYSYGLGGYDILLVDEPRNLTPGEKIAVGCEVKPGKDWGSSDWNVTAGVVIKVDKRNKKATVRWNNGRKGEYTYGDGNLLQITVITDENHRQNHSRHSTEYGSASASTDKWESPSAKTVEEFSSRRNKNKNKNSNQGYKKI